MRAESAFFYLGSNLGDRVHYLRSALEQLRRRLALPAVSSVYETEPFGVQNQPWFLNLACRVLWPGSPEDLLDLCQAVERQLGRTSKGDYGPRTIDIDILLLGNRIIRTPRLEVPHPRLYTRRFVLMPLEEIAPAVRDPLSGKTIREILAECRDGSTVLRLGTRLEFGRDGGATAC